MASSESSSHPSLKCDNGGWPACTGFHRNGRLASVAHMKLGAICDPKPGVPAKRYYGDDGRLLGVEHWSTSSELPYATWDVDKGWDIEPGWYGDNPRFVEYDPTEAGWLASDRARRP